MAPKEKVRPRHAAQARRSRAHCLLSCIHRARAQSNKKQEMKKQDAVVQDRTFGLKNKGKSAKVQKFVQQVQQQARSGLAQKGMHLALWLGQDSEA